MNALAKKLLMKPGQQWLILNAPDNYPALLDPLPDNLQLIFEAGLPVDGMQLFIKNSAELTETLNLVKLVITDATVLWIVYPKKSSGIPTDLEMMGSWDAAAKHDLRPVSSAAVNDTWTALRFRPEHLVKKSDSSKAAVKQNEYSEFIDPDKKLVTLPPDLMDALAQNAAALSSYQRLAYSNKKEYAIWILSAKQAQTRTDRISKMIEKLLAGKKNPSEK
jgi:hypothetical protein